MSIAKAVFRWLDEHPYIVYGLKKNIINYSSLSRMIQGDLNIKNFDAVIVAIRRYSEKIDYLKSTGKEIINIIKKSKMEIKTGVNVYIIKSPLYFKEKSYLHIITGNKFSVVISESELDINCVKKHTGVMEVRIVSPLEIETTPGVVPFIYNTIAEKGINIIETYSCYSDTIFIFDKKDLLRVLETFQDIGIK